MTESELQNSAAMYLRANGVAFHHSPNEGKHRVQYRVKQKRAGMMPGFPDLVLLYPNRPPHFIELKTPKGRLSDAQKGFMQMCDDMGFPFAICRSLDDVQNTVRGWA